MTSFQLNGEPKSVDVSGDMPVLWLLRDTLGLTGTKFGCGISMCGACTIHLNGQPMRSCVTPTAAIEGQQITTIEAISSDPVGRAVEDAWVRNDVVQCGYCQSGQIMAAVALLKANRSPSDSDIVDAMTGNICRCGTYARIHAAVKDAAQALV